MRRCSQCAHYFKENGVHRCDLFGGKKCEAAREEDYCGLEARKFMLKPLPINSQGIL